MSLSLLKIAPPHGASGPHLIHGSLGLLKSSAQTAPRSVQPFLQISTFKCLTNDALVDLQLSQWFLPLPPMHRI